MGTDTMVSRDLCAKMIFFAALLVVPGALATPRRHTSASPDRAQARTAAAEVLAGGYTLEEDARALLEPVGNGSFVMEELPQKASSVKRRVSDTKNMPGKG